MIVAKHAQGMHHGQQLQDMGWICLLGQCKFAAFIGYRVAKAIIIGLREDCQDHNLARIRCEN